MNIIITGYGEHGKDAVADILARDYNLSCCSSSWMACMLFIYHTLKPLLGYTNMEQCYNDRRNHRVLWYELIRAYNHRNRARLAEMIFKLYEVYVGIRDLDELNEIRRQGLVDAVIWVDASERKPPETDSMTVGPECADYILSNNGSLEELPQAVEQMVAWLRASGVRPNTNMVPIKVSKATADHMLEQLEAPPQPNEELQRAAAEYRRKVRDGEIKG